MDSELYVLVAGLGATATVLGVIFAWLSYRLRQTEWLYRLYEKYFESQDFRDIQEIILYREPEKIRVLKQAIENKQDKELLFKLDQYLNFFEFVGSLRRLRRFDRKAVKMLFAYNLRSIRSIDFLVFYIREYGYDNLRRLLRSYR